MEFKYEPIHSTSWWLKMHLSTHPFILLLILIQCFLYTNFCDQSWSFSRFMYPNSGAIWNGNWKILSEPILLSKISLICVYLVNKEKVIIYELDIHHLLNYIHWCIILYTFSTFCYVLLVVFVNIVIVKIKPFKLISVSVTNRLCGANSRGQ